MGFREDYNPKIEYKFRFIGEQKCEYERKNMYESEDLYSVKVELVNPLTGKIEVCNISQWNRPITRKDVLAYIDNMISDEEYFEKRRYKRKRKEELLCMFKIKRYEMSYDELYELIELLQNNIL